MVGSQSLAGCPDKATRNPTDVVFVEAGPRDSGPRADAGDAGTTNSDGGFLMNCNPSNSIQLFDTPYLVGGEVPFGAGAGLDGLVVAASVQTDANYPFYDRISAFLSMGGVVSATQPVSAGAMVPSLGISIVPNGSGVIALYDEVATGGMPRELFVRLFDANGAPAAGPTQITMTTSAESKATIVQLTTGYGAIWLDSATGGATTAVLNADGTINGAAHDASSVTGSSASIGMFGIGSTAYAVYLGTDSRLHGAPLSGTGVIGTATTLNLTDSNANFAVAGAPGGAGLVYESVGFASQISIKFRALTAAGTGVILERDLTATGEQGFRPSIAPLAGGYLVLFRYVPAVGTAKLRLMVLSTNGDTLAVNDLVDAYPATGRYAVRVSPDEDVYVVYQLPVSVILADASTPGAEVRAMQVQCQ